MLLWIWNGRHFRPILGEWKRSHLLSLPNHLSFDLLSFFPIHLPLSFSLSCLSGLDYRFLSHESRKLQTNDWEWRMMRLKMLSSLSLIWFSHLCLHSVFFSLSASHFILFATPIKKFITFFITLLCQPWVIIKAAMNPRNFMNFLSLEVESWRRLRGETNALRSYETIKLFFDVLSWNRCCYAVFKYFGQKQIVEMIKVSIHLYRCPPIILMDIWDQVSIFLKEDWNLILHLFDF